MLDTDMKEYWLMEVKKIIEHRLEGIKSEREQLAEFKDTEGFREASEGFQAALEDYQSHIIAADSALLWLHKEIRLMALDFRDLRRLEASKEDSIN